MSASPAPPLVVVSPNGSEEWGGGTAHQIRWVAEPGIENVRIEYSTDDGSTWTSIISSAPNTGSYAWAVPEEVSPVARVRISDAADGEPVDVSDWPSVIRPYLAPLVNWVSHHRPTVFPQELLTITAQVSPTEAPVSQVGALIYRDESPVVEVVLEDDGVAPDEVAGDQIYSGQWSTAQVGGYRINLLAEDREGIQGVREYADFFTVAHTILSFPDNMMISPEGLSGVRIPLLLEDDGSGRLNQGFLSAQFGIQMQGNSMIPSQIDTSFEGTRLEGQSFSSAVNAFPGGRLEVALANAAPLHLSSTPGPAQQVLTYVDTDLELVNPGGYFYLYVTRALFDEDADSVSISCCGGVTLGRGDVDLSGGIESFDASLALMHSVYNIDLNWAGNPLNDPVESQYGFTVPNLAWLQADVTGQLGVTAFDAALILRHEVGLITHFPAEEGYYRLWDPPPGWWNPPAPAAPKPVAAATAPLHKVVHAGPVEEEEEEVVVPVEIDGMEGILAGSFVLRYQPERLQVVEVRKGPLTADYILMHHVGGDAVRVAFAGAQWPQGGGRLAEVVFRRQRGRGVELGPLALSEVQLNEGEVQVEVEESLSRSVSHLPQALALQPNYPNPFNPSTAIRYEMPAGAPVEVSIYNLVGQRIRIMGKGGQGGGYHQVVWDGRDEAGKEVSTGIYLCRLETGGHTLVRKMLLVK
ncbi:MAG: T9SS type A sorting domain-containing protein [Candidatus Latescibacteria bacterium]|nr:T9SS type A sorting domain-containing protein [Candidatus Latescibacterota bacterium]